VHNYRFPDGVEFEGEADDGNVTFKVTIPTDEDDFLGRECPSCGELFRISHADYDRLPDDLELFCVYCGHHTDHGDFMTQQQRDRVMRAAGDYAIQLAHQSLDRIFTDVTRGSSVLSYRSTPIDFHPDPLPEIDEERLVRERVCPDCCVHYAVFGETRFCPICGPLPPIVAAKDALAADVARLDAFTGLSQPAIAALREKGVIDRSLVDTIENLVGTVEALADATFRTQVPTAAAIVAGKGKVFQRLTDTAVLFADHLGADLPGALGAGWQRLLEVWAARHVFTHCDGIVDAKYLSTAAGSTLAVGQRLRISEPGTREAISLVDKLCDVIAAAVPR